MKPVFQHSRTLRSALLLCISIAGSATAAYSQLGVHPDTLYTFIRYNSVQRAGADWPTIDRNFKAELSQARNISDTMKCFVHVLAQLNDVHSQIFLQGKTYGHYPSYPDSTLARLSPMVSKSNAIVNRIATRILPGQVAYVRVPGMQAYAPEQVNSLARALYDSVQHFNPDKINGMIIDLRLNGGGNLYPMLAGLSPLLGNSKVGQEISPEGEVSRTWEIRDCNFYMGTYQTTHLPQCHSSGWKEVKVVVLLGPVTLSSGSMTAIALKGRPGTVFIGEPTADGYTTSNNYFQFASQLTLNFATHFVADRNGNVYRTVVPPDILVWGGDNFDDLPHDKKIAAALRWLIENHKHSVHDRK